MPAPASNIEPIRNCTPGYHPTVIVLAAAATGIIADRYRPMPVVAWITIAIIAGASWFDLWRKGRFVSSSLVLLIATAATAAAWHHCCWNLFGEDDITFFTRTARQPVCIEAVALQSPRILPPKSSRPLEFVRSGDEVRFEVELRAIRDGAQWRPASGRAMLTVAGLLPNIQAGDRLQAFAHLSQIDRAMNPGELDRANIARGNRLCALLQTNYAESVSRLSGGFFLSPRRLLDGLRKRGHEVFQRYLRPEQAAVASTVLLGLREQVDPDEAAAFQETGTMHLLVIAGLHLGILAGAASVVLRRLLPRRLGLLAVAAFTVGYMFLVDAEPPVVRATILIVGSCLATYCGRRRTGFNVLATAALIVLAMNPVDLFRVGAQLSFLCVAALMWLGPTWIFQSPKLGSPELLEQSQQWSQNGRLWLAGLLPKSRATNWLMRPRHAPAIEKLLAEERPWPIRILWFFGRGLRHVTLVSGMMWLCTMPLVTAQFHIFNPVSVLLNTLVWIPMALALVSGLALLLCGMLPGPLALLCAPLCATACNSAINIVEWLVQEGQRMPLGHAWVPGPTTWWLIGFYLALGLVAAFPLLCPTVRWRLAMLGVWTALGVAVPWWTTDRQGLRCTFLSVGHGEAIVMA